MATIDDLASDNEERFRDAALREFRLLHPPATRESAAFCIDCGDPIPERRRLAVPGVIRCITCAEWKDKWNRLSNH